MGKGNIIGKANEPTANVASGVWSMREQYAAVRGNVWPTVAVTIDFTISPAVSGKTSWSLSTDGALNLGTTGEWTITASRTVTVSAKMWGAGGGPGGSYTAANPPTTQIGPGGGGGYATGTFQLVSGSSYILRVGRGGRREVVSGLNSTGATHLSGGARAPADGSWATEGGGYTGLFASSVSQANAWLMAGGGGGGYDTAFATSAGAGGGTNGASGSSAGSQSGSGGTQSAGGAASAFNSATAGSALTGGLSQTLHSGGGGGGGGYFGGGGSNVGGGGGGSGYFKSGTVSSATLTAGSSDTPGNSADADRSGAGAGGTGSTNGADGRARIAFVSAP